jgi:predicted nucleotidyltransferase
MLNQHSVIEDLIKEYDNPETIVLFGSFAHGEDIEKSDIDILIITTNESKGKINKTLISFEKEINRKISIHVLPNLHKSSEEFKNNTANGITLHGYLKVI